MNKTFTLIILFITLAIFKANAQNGQYVGGDISDLTLYEQHNSGYLDGSGNKINDLITWFTQECGWNSFRVRLFVNPTKKDNDNAVNMSVCQDIDYVKALGKRIKDAGASFMLDFHYADTWVDATHIHAPSVCSSMTTAQKAEWIYTYTKQSLETLKAAGATPDLVQVGNEIMYGFMGVTVAPYDKSGNDWDGYLSILKQGCQAVRDVCPTAKIIIHTDRPCNTGYNKYYYSKLDAASVPYDVIGLSYYPIWHGYLTKAQDANFNLEAALNQLATDFPGKEVQIVETAYNFQYWPSSGVSYNTQTKWACSADGQYKFVKELIAELAKHSNVKGLFYWFPEEAGCGDDTDWDSQKYGNVITSWMNRGLWWEDQKTDGHWPVKATDGMVHYLFKDFLDPNLANINTITAPTPSSSDAWFTLSGSRIAKPTQKGIYINGNKKVVVK